MKKPQMLKDYFRLLMEKCHPDGVNLEQWNEMEMAFYAGAQSFAWATDEAMRDGTEDECHERYAALHKELEDYARSKGVKTQ